MLTTPEQTNKNKTASFSHTPTTPKMDSAVPAMKLAVAEKHMLLHRSAIQQSEALQELMVIASHYENPPVVVPIQYTDMHASTARANLSDSSHTSARPGRD